MPVRPSQIVAIVSSPRFPFPLLPLLPLPPPLCVRVPRQQQTGAAVAATVAPAAAATAAAGLGTVSRAGRRLSRHTVPSTLPPLPSAPPSLASMPLPSPSSSHPRSSFTFLRSPLSFLTLRLPPTLSHSPLLLLLLCLSLSLGSFFLAAPSSSASSPAASETFSGASARTGSKSFSADPGVASAARGMATAVAAEAGAGAGGGGPVIADTVAGDAVVVYITVPNKEAGQKLAASMVGARLAACVNRVPGVESTYWWQGKIETDNEELLIVKTRRALLPSIQEHLKTNHPYDVPELIAVPIVGGSEGYLKWLHENAPSPPTAPSP